MKCPIPGCEKAHKNQFEHYSEARGVNLVTEKPLPVTKSVTKPLVTKQQPVTKSDKDRVYTWRAKNRDRYNESQRELMRKRKA